MIISGGEVYSSVLSPMVSVHSWAQVQDAIIMHGVRVGRRARVRRAILDKNVIVEEDAQIGFDHEYDRERGMTVTESGIVVAPKGLVVKK